MANIEKHFSRNLITLEADAPCQKAARVMAEYQVGAVIVRDGNQTVGMVTDRDLVTNLIAQDASAHLPLRNVMRSDIPRVPPTASELECSNLMRDRLTRYLMVAEEGEVIGILSMRDVIRAMLDEKQFIIEQLQSYITRA
jgi:signal-transduction protein with cAMP-binding, CBS, and nucleotidyltransferase domain